MTINKNDVKLYESQRLSDEENVGGRVTGRKAFIAISTDNNDTYLGSHLILTEPPNDKNVNVFYSKATAKPMNPSMPGTGSRAMWC